MLDVETSRNFTFHKFIAAEALQDIKYREEFYYNIEVSKPDSWNTQLSNLSICFLLPSFPQPEWSIPDVTVLEK